MAAKENSGCLFALLDLFLRKRSAQKDAFPYRISDVFLSPAELLFYQALRTAVHSRAVICPKVNLSDVFFVVDLKQNYGARGRISQKHVDFLLCDPQTMGPLVGVELDDASHGRSDRQARDEFVDKVFKAAGLPLIHVPCRSGYEPATLAALLAPYLAGLFSVPKETISGSSEVQVAPGLSSVSHSMPVAAPMCPKCGTPLVLRQSTRGAFYGCPNYPKCRQTLPAG